jgi:flagellar secretion chaperone FliS
MKKELVKEFQTRIVNAGRSELLIINYEMLLAQLDDAILAIESENKEEFSRSILNARKLLNELSSGLDFKYDIAKELMSIYIYVNKKFAEATVSYKVKDILEAKKY